jgi:uncharacterized cupredoxin-like copper-binding protein
MFSLSRIAGGCALAVATLVMPPAAGIGAAEEPTTVRVALLDMSALVPGARGPGFGGMGWGPGGDGRGFGMMGPGMMGAGGPMMGMMTIRADETRLAAGPVTFDVTNWSRSIVHEAVVIAVDSPDAPLPYDYAKQLIPEDQIKILGETEELEPSASKALDVALSPGNYLLVCNVPGHYAAGMVLPITVVP